MENLEIIERENDITYQIPQVNFPAFEDYKQQAEAVSAYIRSLPVTQENIKKLAELFPDVVTEGENTDGNRKLGVDFME